jgi:putative ABC transport system permease protein
MWRAAFRSLFERKLRLALTTISIVLGVGFVAGTYVLTDSIDRAFKQIFTGGISGFDILVRTKPAFEGAERDRVPGSLVGDIRKIKGVRAAAGSVEDVAQIIDDNGKPIGGQGPPTIASTTHDNPLLRGDSRIVAGRSPRTTDEVVLDRYTADQQQWKVGRKIKIQAGGPVRDFTLVGLFEIKGVPNFGGATVVVFNLKSAQEIFHRGDAVDTVEVRAETGQDVGELRRRVDERIGNRYQVVARTTLIQEAVEDIGQFLGFLSNALLTFGFIALFVGAFLIFNTFSILFAQRKREFAMLRAIGAKGSQVFRVVLAETLLIGLVASAVGVGVGMGLAVGLQRLLKAFKITLPTSGTPLLPRTIIVSMIVGTLVTLVAGFVPAVRASRIAPLEALREASLLPSKKRIRRRIVVGLVILAGGVGALVWGMFGDPPNRLVVLGSGAAATLLSVAVMAPAITKPLSVILGWPIAKVLGISGDLARGNAVRDRYRTAATASALMIGVALVTMIAVLAASIRASADRANTEHFRADFLLTVLGPTDIGPDLLPSIRDLPEVEEATSLRSQAGLLAGDNVSVARTVGVGGIVPKEAQRLIFTEMKEGELTDLTDGIFLHEDLAKSLKVELGDEINARFPRSAPTEAEIARGSGPGPPISRGTTGLKKSDFEQLEVQGIFSDGFVGRQAVIARDTYEKKFIDQRDGVIFVQAASTVSLKSAKQALEKVAKGYPQVQVFDQAGLRAQNARGINQLLGLVYALLFLAILIALFGIVNTLILSVLERTREIGLLRAVGLTRRQVRRMIRWESIIVSIMGSLLGTGVGVFFAWILVQGLRDEGLDIFRVPGRSLAIYVAIAAVAGVIAAIGPARRAARVDVLRAIAYE